MIRLPWPGPGELYVTPGEEPTDPVLVEYLDENSVWHRREMHPAPYSVYTAAEIVAAVVDDREADPEPDNATTEALLRQTFPDYAQATLSELRNETAAKLGMPVSDVLRHVRNVRHHPSLKVRVQSGRALTEAHSAVCDKRGVGRLAGHFVSAWVVPLVPPLGHRLYTCAEVARRAAKTAWDQTGQTHRERIDQIYAETHDSACATGQDSLIGLATGAALAALAGAQRWLRDRRNR